MEKFGVWKIYLYGMHFRLPLTISCSERHLFISF